MRIGLIHAPTLADTPFSDDHCGDDVDDDRENRDQREPVIIRNAKCDGREDQPHKSRADIESKKADQIVNRARAALDHTIERAGATGLVKVERQGLRMSERIHAGNTLGILTDRREQPVSRLGQSSRQKPHSDANCQPHGSRAKGRGLSALRDGLVDGVPQQERRNHFQH